MRRLPLDCTHNTRDLGGYPTIDGRATRYKAFYRSDVILSPTVRDLALLRAANITDVIDLRSNRETVERPAALSDVPGIHYHPIAMPGGGRLPVDDADVVASYMEMIGDPDALLAISEILAGAEGAVLYHCTAGKDRTGVLSALLLTLAGVALPDILADYCLSHSYLLPFIRDLTKQGLAAHIITPRAEYMEGFLSAFHARYGCVENYHTAIGIPCTATDTLRQKILL